MNDVDDYYDEHYDEYLEPSDDEQWFEDDCRERAQSMRDYCK